MPTLDTGALTLVGITLFAAFVNGALGYGFSSLTVPIALFFYANRVLNPALVGIELVINVFVLIVNRDSVPAVWRRVSPMLIGLLPGVLLGSYLLASLHPAWIKLGTYGIILPLILIQAAGIRRPIRSERVVGVPFGAGVGFLYSVTTVSGPPLAVMFNNQGLVKKEFRAALGLIRVAESGLTALAYWHLGVFSQQSAELAALIAPGVLLGIPLGTLAIRRMNPETFRRICMSFDVYIVGFGLARVLTELKLADSLAAYGVMAAAIVIDTWLLYVFFTSPARRAGAVAVAAPPSAPASGILRPWRSRPRVARFASPSSPSPWPVAPAPVSAPASERARRPSPSPASDA